MFDPRDETTLTQIAAPPKRAAFTLASDHPHASLVAEGLRQAALISNPVARGRHRAAWAVRLSAVEPEAAAELLAELPEEGPDRLYLLQQVIQDRVRRGDRDLEPHFSHALDLARAAGPDYFLRALNTLSEAAVDLAGRNPETALRLLHLLAAEARSLLAAGEESRQGGVLAAALVGEALLAAGDAAGGLPLLHTAEEQIVELPGRDPIAAFLASALAEREPERAAALGGSLEDAGARLESRLQLVGKVTDERLRGELLEGIAVDGRQLEHYRGPEALAQVAEALIRTAPEQARQLFAEALESAERSGGQFIHLQLTGIAGAASPLDREWAGELFQAAIAGAETEEEPIRRITTQVLIANEMADSFPREAGELFQRAMADAAQLDANWELGHVADIVFRGDRSPYIDVHSARPVIDRLLERLSDEDPRIPGVIGLAEAAQWMAQVDPEAAISVLQRWFRAAQAAADTDGMTTAAAAIQRLDSARGEAAIRETYDYLLHRIDCPAMGEFSRQVAAIDPELVLRLAERIPDGRERSDARAAAAASLYEQDPGRALEIIGALERPVDRSSALLRMADALLGTADRAQPQPLLEDMP